MPPCHTRRPLRVALGGVGRATARPAGVGALVVVLLFARTAGAQSEASWYGHVTIANDFRRHGVSQVYSGGSLQAGFDYQHPSGFFVGVAAANLDHQADTLYLPSPRSSQARVYLGYHWNGADWQVNTELSTYRYPDLVTSYDYTEMSVGVIYRDRYLASVNYSDEILGLWGAAIDYEAGVAWPLGRGIELSGTIGRFDSRDFFGIQFTHWNLGISKPLRRFAVDLRYHDTSNAELVPLGNANSERWVLSLSYALKKR